MDRLEEEQLRARAVTQAAAQVQIQEQVKKVLDEEKAAHQRTLTDVIMRERMNTEDERLIAQYYVRHHLATLTTLQVYFFLIDTFFAFFSWVWFGFHGLW